jgi:hypothetical protein
MKRKFTRLVPNKPVTPDDVLDCIEVTRMHKLRVASPDYTASMLYCDKCFYHIVGDVAAHNRCPTCGVRWVHARGTEAEINELVGDLQAKGGTLHMIQEDPDDS